MGAEPANRSGEPQSATLSGFLQTAFRIRPGETRAVVLMFFYVMSVVATIIVGRSASGALFLYRVSDDQLPLIYLPVAAAIAFASWLYSRIADKYRRDRLIILSLSIFVVVLTGFWLLIQMGVGSEIYAAVYIAIEVLSALAIMQCWTFASDVFSGRQAKRLFSVIAAGGVLANVFFGLATGKYGKQIGAENLLLVNAALFVACILLVRAVAARAQADLELAIRKKPKRSRLRIGAESERVLHSKHLQIIAGIVFITFLTTPLIDFQFKALAKEYFSEDGWLTFSGYFMAATGVISSLFQFLVTGRLLERSGVVVALLVLPVAMSLGVIGILVVPIASVAIAAIAAKGSENIFRYTVNDAATQLLYVPVPSHHRGRAKAFIDGILKPSSMAIAGLMLLILRGWMKDPRELALFVTYVDLGLLIAWIVLVIGIRKEYVKSLIETLQSRRLDLTGAWSPVIDESTQRLLQSRLLSADDNDVLTTLEILPSIRADFHDELIRLLEHPSEKVRIAAVTLIGESGRLEGGEEIHRLCRDPSPKVRSAAITAFCAVARERAVHSVRTFLNDPDGAVRASAVAAMIRHGGLDGILTAAETLKAFLESKDPEERLLGARVLRDIKVRNFFQPVLTLLEDEDPRVRIAAVEAAGEMQSPELVPALVYKLGDQEAGMPAVRALVAYGVSIEKTLFKALRNAHENIHVRRRIPRVLERIGRQEAFEQLLAAVDTPDTELRNNVARAAARIREREPHLKVNDHQLNTVIREQIKAAFQTLNVLADLGLPEDHLLHESLVERHRTHLSLAFRLLEIRYPARTIQLVYANLDSDNKAVRANALEVVDNVLSSEEARLLLPLLEDHTIDDKVQKGRELFSTERKSADQWLDELIVDGNPWIVSCTIHHVADQRLTRFVPRIFAHLDSPRRIVRETAILGLNRLLGAGRPNDLEISAEALTRQTRILTEDKVPEVRRAASLLLTTLDPSLATS